MKKFLVSMAVAALAIPALAQSSAPARVAVIDVNKVLSSSTAGKVAAAKLKQLQEDKMARAQKLDEEIKTLDNDINTKKISLSEEQTQIRLEFSCIESREADRYLNQLLQIVTTDFCFWSWQFWKTLAYCILNEAFISTESAEMAIIAAMAAFLLAWGLLGHRPTMRFAWGSSFKLETPAGFPLGTTTTNSLRAKISGSAASFAATSACMCFWSAEANTSAGAPFSICVRSSWEPARLKRTLVPGCFASNRLPSSANDSRSEAAAKTFSSFDPSARAAKTMPPRISPASPRERMPGNVT